MLSSVTRNSVAFTARSALTPASSTRAALPSNGSVRHAGSLKEVKNRMRSVQSISKITSAMKMVAAAKLRNVEKSLLAARPFVVSTKDVFDKLTPKEVEGQCNTTVVAVTSDKGLCGGINSAIAKKVKLHVKESGEKVSMILVGDKGKSQLQREHKDKFVFTIRDVGAKGAANFTQASNITENVLANDFDRCDIVYNRFKNAASFIPESVEIPSYERLAETDKPEALDEFEFDSDKASTLQDLYEFHIATNLYGAFLENATSELASRTQAMGNASKNSAEMLDKLTILYNRSRQAQITTELIEIISGAESLKG